MSNSPEVPRANDQLERALLVNARLNKPSDFAKLRNFRKDSAVFVNVLFNSTVKDRLNTATHLVNIQQIEASQATPIAS